MRIAKRILAFIFTFCFLVFLSPARGQQPSEGRRKVIRRTEPRYPEMARTMHISGTVKMFAVVAPDGTVRTIEPIGGSPLLVQASQVAVKEWKFAPAAEETKELIELHFSQ